MRIFILLLVSICITTVAFSQSTNTPEVGKPLPDYKLNNIRYSDKKEAQLSEYKGKWLFLELWTSGCPASLKSLPIANELYKEFREEMNFLLVGCTDPKACWGNGLRETYEQFRKKAKLEIPCAFDSLLARKWDIWSSHRIFLIDPSGIVRAETGDEGLKRENIRAILDGKIVKFSLARQDDPKEFALDVNKDRHLYYNSTLLNWNGERYKVWDVKDYIKRFKRPTYQASKITLLELYNLAFHGKAYLNNHVLKFNPLYGQVAYHPILELDDSAAFYEDSKVKYYNYSLNIPDSSLQEEDLKKAIQKDLEHIFGYAAAIEEREMPVWRLIATEEAKIKLKTSGAPSYFSDNTASGGVGGFTLINNSMEVLSTLLIRYIKDKHIPYIDETGITGNIDITIDALLMDFDDIQRELKRNGLQFVKGKKKMAVIVIRQSPVN